MLLGFFFSFFFFFFQRKANTDGIPLVCEKGCCSIDDINSHRKGNHLDAAIIVLVEHGKVGE